MITPVTSTQTDTSSFQLPADMHQPNVRETFFGQIFEENNHQFATQQTAQALAKFVGGVVVDMSGTYAGGTQAPQYEIQMPDGSLYNAGLLADEFSQYGVAYASRMFSDEAHVTLPTASPAQVEVTQSGSPGPLVTGSIAATPRQIAAAAAPTAAVTTTTAATTTATATRTAATTAAAALVPTSGDAGAAPTKGATTIVDAAHQFEALMLSQFMRAVQDSSAESSFGTDDQSAQSVLQLAQEQFAQALAAQGGLGLAKLVSDGLQKTTS